MSHKETMHNLIKRLPKPINRKAASLTSDWFQKLVQWPVWHTALVFVLVLATMTFAFAGLYELFGPYPCPTDTNASAETVFADVLMYSVSITSTLLQARCIPLTSDEAMIVANFHGWLMLIITVFLTGVVFTRMSKPGMQVQMSSKMLINHDDPHLGPVLMTRMYFNKRESSLIDAKFNIMFSRRLRPHFVKTDLLELVRPEAPILVVGTSIMVRSFALLSVRPVTACVCACVCVYGTRMY